MLGGAGIPFFDLVDGALERGFEFVGIDNYILSRATSPRPSSSRLMVELGKSDTKPFHYRQG